MSTTEAVIVDLDGTLADVVPARHHVQKRPGHKRDFAAFHGYATTEAQPIPGTVTCVRAHAARDRRIILVSGRHEKWRPATMAWLAKHDVPWHELHMRADNDGRQDTDVKLDIYRAHIEPSYRVVEAFDDRPSIIELWQSLGIPVHVVPGWTEADGA